MGAFFGWILIATAVYLLVSAFRRPAAPAPAAAAGETGRGPYLWGGVAALVVGLLLAVWPLLASVRMEAAELSRKDNWATRPSEHCRGCSDASARLSLARGAGFARRRYPWPIHSCTSSCTPTTSSVPNDTLD